MRLKIRQLWQRIRLAMAVAGIAFAMNGAAHAAIIISEVHPTGSSGTFGADWFELTNTGPSAVNISGWKIDDNSNSSASDLVLRNVTSINAGQSIVFFEGNTSGSNFASKSTDFINAWFNGSAPAGFVLGDYGGSSVSLGSSGDAVNIYDSSNTLVTSVSFGAATTGVTFDNAAGASGLISTLSSVGINGAFTGAPNGEIGSPGAIQNVPEPSTIALFGMGGLAVVLTRRRRRK